MQLIFSKTYKLVLLTLVFTVILFPKIYSQTAATCSAAISTTVGGVCKPGTTAGTIENPNTSLCGGGLNRDIWYKFIATASTATLVSSGSAGATPTVQLIVEAYSGTCPALSSTLAAAVSLGCTNANLVAATTQTETLNLNSLTPGTTYFVRLFNCTAFNISTNLCITSTPDNDEPNGAVPLTVNSSCSYTGSTTKSATQTSCGGIAAPSCGTYGASSVDVWFSATVPLSGNLFLQTLNSGMSNAGMAAYSAIGPCSGMVEIGCSDGNPSGVSGINPPMTMPTLFVTGASPGSTIYIRVWNKDTKATGTFSICATTLGPCGNAANNDFCSNPASLTPSAGTFSSSTNALYTADNPGNFSAVFTGTNAVTNNSWYSFIASATTQTFGFATSGCTNGIAIEGYSVTTNAYGCCKNFTNSIGPIVETTSSATLSLNPLTIGSTYYIMVNGLVAGCSYTVTGWSATGILPIELVSFTGTNQNDVNFIEWVTASELNNSYYTLERSSDASVFEKVFEVKAYGDGNSTARQVYRTYDSQPNKELTYYRLKQTDLNGKSRLSHIISVMGPDFYETIYNLYPNPTTNNLNFEYYSKSNSNIYMEIIGYAGNVALAVNQPLEEGLNSFILPMSQLNNGVYILKVVSEKTGKTTHHKIIKN